MADKGSNIAIRDIAEMYEVMGFEDDLEVVAIKEEKIPPHTANPVKVGIKGVNVGCVIYSSEEMINRGLMVKGGKIVINRAEDEIFEIEIPVYNMGDESVNISVGDVVGVILLSNTDAVLEDLTEEEFDNWNGDNVWYRSYITVIDSETDKPIEGATVTIGEVSVETDENGKAEFMNLARGSVSVAASAEGYTELEDSIDLASLNEATIELVASD